MSPRTATQNARIREEARDRIVAGSLAVFAERGFQGASMQEIARRSGVSKGLAYHYFDAKEDLLAAALRAWLDGLLEIVSRPPATRDPSTCLAALIDALLEYVAQNPAVFRLYLGLALDTPQHVRRRVSEELGEPLQQYLRTFEELFEELRSPEPHADALLLRSTLMGLSLRIAAGDEEARSAAVRARLLGAYAPQRHGPDSPERPIPTG